MVVVVSGRFVPAPQISQWRFPKMSFYSVVYGHSIRVSNAEENMPCISKKSINLRISATAKQYNDFFCHSWGQFDGDNSLMGIPKGYLAELQLFSVSLGKPRQALLFTWQWGFPITSGPWCLAMRLQLPVHLYARGI